MPRSCPCSDEETKWQVTRRLTSVEELATDDNGAPETITSSSRLVRRPIRIIDSLLSRRNSQMSNTRRESIFRKYFDQTEAENEQDIEDFLEIKEAVLAFRIFREALMTTTWCYHRR
ncbi:uncharacterized protein LOC102677841 [Apis dorsata]|uniref:uncharacterized protein LOC102677841 n=1 Tax=Apis dorsata TaxID=7462 RepID=UPI0003DF68A9|nr:uncharacterized protein LOC102677841 [Apis dorsata]